MNSAILSKSFFVFILFSFIFLLQTGVKKTQSKQQQKITISERQILQKTFPNFYQAYQTAINSTSPELQLAAINNALAIAETKKIS